MRRTPVAIALVALLLVVVLAMVTGSTASQSSVPKAGTAAVTSVTVVCPELTGSPPGTVSRASIANVASALTPATPRTGAVATTVLAGHKSKTATVQPNPATVVHSVTKTDQQVEVSATGSIAATIAADVVSENANGRSRQLAAAHCVAPATDWWFTGADGRIGFSDVLIMSNPAPTAAEVSISLWGQTGPHDNTQLESVRVNAQSSVRVPISSAAPDIATVGIHVHSTSGAVSAALLDHRTATLKSNGGDFIPATAPPSRSEVLPGFAPGKGPRYLIVTAPGSLDATVNLRLVTKSGSFAPSGINQFVVRGGHSKAISVSGPLGQSTGAVVITSDQPVIANGLSVLPSPGERPDLMWSAAGPPLSGPSPIANGHQPDGGHAFLYLAAPQGAGEVNVTAPGGHTQTISVPAGKAVVTDITATIKSAAVTWPYVVTPVGTAPVYAVAAMTFAGAHGALIASEPLIALPKPITLPPVREDASIAAN